MSLRTAQTPASDPAASAALPTLADLWVLEESLHAAWVFDPEAARILWANPAGLALWAAPDLQELTSRELGADMSSSVRLRLQQFVEGFRAGAHHDEPWTIYPRGKPRPLMCRFRGCLLPDGRIGILADALQVGAEDRSLVMSAQVMIYTTSMVSTYALDGRCTYANLAALRAFPGRQQSELTRFLDPTIRAVLATGERPAEGTYMSEVMTSRGIRTHEVSIRLGHDPMDGAPSFVLTETDVTDQENAKRDLEVLASRDPLTGLRNRAYLATAASGVMGVNAARGQRTALMLLDLDRFKFVNDSLGHAAGDRLLQEIAERLTQALPPGTALSRLGGDEFCCLLACERERDLQRQAGAVLKALGRPLRVEGNDLSVSGSIGLSVTEGTESSFDELLRQADLALFEAKGNGGGEARMYRPELAERSQHFLKMEAELREALRRRRLELYYQPRLSLKTGRIVAAEALIRINSASGTQVMPGDFIPVAEATGRIAPIGRWALRAAAQHLGELRSGGARVDLSVNVSPKQFADPAFLKQLRQARSLLDPHGGVIELEVTEQVLVESDKRLQRVMQQISAMGYTFAIDDFGTAYSNLAGLARYPVGCIKIDRTLIAHQEFRLLVSAVLTIAKAMGAKVVAEGVETEEQRDWLQEAGCDEFQGYLFSRPVPFAELQRLLAAGY